MSRDDDDWITDRELAWWMLVGLLVWGGIALYVVIVVRTIWGWLS